MEEIDSTEGEGAIKVIRGRSEDRHDLHISQIWAQQAFIAHESSLVE
jgi:hypothetical protein